MTCFHAHPCPHWPPLAGTCPCRLLHASVCPGLPHTLCAPTSIVIVHLNLPALTCPHAPLPVRTCNPTASLVHMTSQTRVTCAMSKLTCFNLLILPAAETSRGSHPIPPNMFSHVHVCVCAFPWLVSWLHNRISRDFAAVTQTSVCVWERERVERAARRFRPRPYEWPQSDPRLRLSRSPGQHRVKNSLLTHEQGLQ